MPQNVIRESIERRLAEGTELYAAQRAYVKTMLRITERLLVAAGRTDPEVQRELEGFPDGFVLGFSIIGSDIKVRLRVRGGRLERMDPMVTPELDIIFKHITHAFMVFSFQESTAQAFANQRFITQGDAALSMRFTRCLNRVQAVSLPNFIASRALKALPPIPFGRKLALSAQWYALLPSS
jgi:hypothetical protein